MIHNEDYYIKIDKENIIYQKIICFATKTSYDTILSS